MYKEILDYQKIDLEIAKIQKENVGNQYSKIISDAVMQVKSMQNMTDKLSKDAEKQIQIYNKLKESLKHIESEVEKLDVASENEDMEKTLKDYMYQINKIQGNIMVLKNNIDKINKMFEEAKIKVVEARIKHKEAKAKQDQIKSDVNKKIEALQNKMTEMEKGISKDLIKKYNDAKNDNIMPVFVSLTSTGACGGCMQKIATNQLNMLKQDNILVCEHCRRYIINEE